MWAQTCDSSFFASQMPGIIDLPCYTVVYILGFLFWHPSWVWITRKFRGSRRSVKRLLQRCRGRWLWLWPGSGEMLPESGYVWRAELPGFITGCVRIHDSFLPGKMADVTFMSSFSCPSAGSSSEAERMVVRWFSGSQEFFWCFEEGLVPSRQIQKGNNVDEKRVLKS